MEKDKIMECITECINKNETLSASYLQRKFKISYEESLKSIYAWLEKNISDASHI